MQRISPTTAAIFLGGVCLGLLASQTLQITGNWLTARPVDYPPAAYSLPPPGSPIAPVDVPLDAGALQTLTEIRARNGSVLKGTVLDEGDNELVEQPEFAAKVKQVEASQR